jgi:hypothetical protein
MDILSGIDGTGPLAKLIYRRAGRSRRISSWDKTGGNRDFLTILQGEIATLAKIEGAGCIRHISGLPSPAATDSTCARPRCGCIGTTRTSRACWRRWATFSGWGTASRARICRCRSRPSRTRRTRATTAAASRSTATSRCPSPQARASKSSTTATPISTPSTSTSTTKSYDAPLPDHVLRFHAHYRQEYPTRGTQGNLFEQRVNYWELLDTPNVSDAENYLILDAEGAGHYVGCVLSVDNIDPLPVIRKLGSREEVIKEYTWWGEGDDMIFIDGEPWPPSLHGTGSEDYLCHAWGMHPKAYLYAGASIPENDPKHPDRRQCTSYRFHIEDPILFTKSIRVSIEHGHANLQENDYSSVAYWYQTEPHKVLPPLPPVAERIPRNMRP